MGIIDKIIMTGIVLCVGTKLHNDLYHELYPNSSKGFWRSLFS
jgi:hypothetical protein